MSSSTKKQLTYAISYGLFSGPAHSKRLRAAMKKAGYDLVDDQANAAIIVAHSAGCWQVSPGANTQLIVYIGMPLALERPFKTWYTANAKVLKSMRNSLDRSWLRYVVRHNIRSMFTQPLRNLRIIRSAKQPHPLPFSLPSILIINNDDVWTHSPKLDHFTKEHNWKFIGLPGSHDDVWQHPDRVVDIINYHAGLLEKTDAR